MLELVDELRSSGGASGLGTIRRARHVSEAATVRSPASDTSDRAARGAPAATAASWRAACEGGSGCVQGWPGAAPHVGHATVREPLRVVLIFSTFHLLLGVGVR